MCRTFVSTIAASMMVATLATAHPLNMLSLQEGTLPLQIPPTYSGWDAQNLLDESGDSGWASETGRIKNNTFIFEVVTPVIFETFIFDNTNVDAEGAAAKNILVEVSNTSPNEGYVPILRAKLDDRLSDQDFPVSTKIPARWVRLTLIDNYGNRSWTELFSFKGLAEKPLMMPPANISGLYDSSYSLFHILQHGTMLSGCYEYDDGLLNGSIEGRVMKLTWHENGGDDDQGPAILVFSEDGESFKGFWWHKGSEMGPPNGTWSGTKRSARIGHCDNWSGSIQTDLARTIDQQRRLSLYGVLFDPDTYTLRPESKPLLDELISLLKTHKEWNLTIALYSDDVGSDDRALFLSQKRAEAVKFYLIKGGIAFERLTSVGYGVADPIGDNHTEAGRAQNRRIELLLH